PYERPRHVHGDVQVSMYERACIQHWLCSMQSWHIGTFEELADGNLFIPEQGLPHRGHPVRGIVRGIVFELLHTRTEPLVGVVMVVGDARAEHIQERETLVAN